MAVALLSPSRPIVATKMPRPSRMAPAVMVASRGNGYGRRPIPLRVSLSPFFSVLAGDFSAPARSEAAPAVLTAGGP
nr:hypothetical protein Itr_chr07CG05810 [Ipomoea trifida]